MRYRLSCRIVELFRLQMQSYRCMVTHSLWLNCYRVSHPSAAAAAAADDDDDCANITLHIRSLIIVIVIARGCH